MRGPCAEVRRQRRHEADEGSPAGNHTNRFVHLPVGQFEAMQAALESQKLVPRLSPHENTHTQHTDTPHRSTHLLGIAQRLDIHCLHLVVPRPDDLPRGVHGGNRLLPAQLHHYAPLVVAAGRRQIGNGGQRGRQVRRKAIQLEQHAPLVIVAGAGTARGRWSQGVEGETPGPHMRRRSSRGFAAPLPVRWQQATPRCAVYMVSPTWPATPHAKLLPQSRPHSPPLTPLRCCLCP